MKKITLVLLIILPSLTFAETVTDLSCPEASFLKYNCTNTTKAEDIGTDDPAYAGNIVRKALVCNSGTSYTVVLQDIEGDISTLTAIKNSESSITNLILDINDKEFTLAQLNINKINLKANIAVLLPENSTSLTCKAGH